MAVPRTHNPRGGGAPSVYAQWLSYFCYFKSDKLLLSYFKSDRETGGGGEIAVAKGGGEEGVGEGVAEEGGEDERVGVGALTALALAR